jgi:hypothetical protein
MHMGLMVRVCMLKSDSPGAVLTGIAGARTIVHGAHPDAALRMGYGTEVSLSLAVAQS